VDRSPEQIGHDIALMQQAGFTLVRMGDLSWDAFEPSEGHFEFAWFDNILEQMNQARISDPRHRRIACANLASP
jgi:beta-galactosidase